MSSRISQRYYLNTITIFNFKIRAAGSACGSVGRMVASSIIGLRFEYSHEQNFVMNICNVNCWKDENKEIRGRKRPILKNYKGHLQTFNFTSTDVYKQLYCTYEVPLNKLQTLKLWQIICSFICNLY